MEKIYSIECVLQNWIWSSNPRITSRAVLHSTDDDAKVEVHKRIYEVWKSRETS